MPDIAGGTVGQDGLPKVLFEPLEPRYLLNAELMPLDIDMSDADIGNDLVLRFDSISQELQILRNDNGMGLVSHRAISEVSQVI